MNRNTYETRIVHQALLPRSLAVYFLSDKFFFLLFADITLIAFVLLRLIVIFYFVVLFRKQSEITCQTNFMTTACRKRKIISLKHSKKKGFFFIFTITLMSYWLEVHKPEHMLQFSISLALNYSLKSGLFSSNYSSFATFSKGRLIDVN